VPTPAEETPRDEVKEIHAASLLRECVTKKERGLILGLNLRELLDTRVLIGSAYIMPPDSSPDLAGDVLEAISLPAGR